MPWVPIVESDIDFVFNPDLTGPTPPVLGKDSKVTVNTSPNEFNSFGGWSIETPQPQRLRVTVLEFGFVTDEMALTSGEYAFYSPSTGWNYYPNASAYPDYTQWFAPTQLTIPDDESSLNFHFFPPTTPDGGTYEFGAVSLVEIWKIDGPGPDPEPGGCFWDGKVMVAEDCGGDVDPPGGDWQPDFGHNVVTANSGMQIYRHHFCDSDLYSAIATGSESLLVTHIGIRGSNAPSPGVAPEDGWICGDGPTAGPTWIALGEPMYMNGFTDGSDNRAWTLPFIGAIPGALGDYYGFVDVRITVENIEGVTQIEGVAFASPGF